MNAQHETPSAVRQPQRLPLLESRERPGEPMRILVVGDREWDNAVNIIDFANTYPAVMKLVGMIVPGGDMDSEIMDIARRIGKMRTNGVAVPDGWPYDPGTGDWHFGLVSDDEYRAQQRGDSNHILDFEDVFSYLHAPYDPKRLRSEPTYRRQYCEKLLTQIQSLNPDYILLSNFKVILDPLLVKAYPGKIINLHPSELPLLKRYLPEFRADQGEDPDALGYTAHMVDIDLDGGATIFQQRVALDPWDFALEAKFGKEKYLEYREEVHRLRIIIAQAEWTPLILALVMSNIPRKIFTDAEAFAQEGRAGFENSPSYHKSLQTDYTVWKREHPENNVSLYDDWYENYRKPYERVLFEVQGEYRTAESILGAPRYAETIEIHPRARYRFDIHGDARSSMIRYSQLFTQAQILAQQTGGQLYHQRAMYHELMGLTRGEILASINLAAVLKDMEFEMDLMPTRVRAPRKPIYTSSEV